MYVLPTDQDSAVGGGPVVSSPQGLSCGIGFGGELIIGGGVPRIGTEGNRPQLWRSDGTNFVPIDTNAMAADDSTWVPTTTLPR